MKDIKTKAEETFTEAQINDIIAIVNMSYDKVNKEIREPHTSLTTIANWVYDEIWNCIEIYSKNKKLGVVKKENNRRNRWYVNGLIFAINKIDEHLNISNKKKYGNAIAKGQVPLSLLWGNTSVASSVEVSSEFPLIIGYMPTMTRSLINEMHIICYKKDGSLGWNKKIYNRNKAFTLFELSENKEIKEKVNNIKIKTPDKKVVDLFTGKLEDKDE